MRRLVARGDSADNGRQNKTFNSTDEYAVSLLPTKGSAIANEPPTWRSCHSRRVVNEDGRPSVSSTCDGWIKRKKSKVQSLDVPYEVPYLWRYWSRIIRLTKKFAEFSFRANNQTDSSHRLIDQRVINRHRTTAYTALCIRTAYALRGKSDSITL